MKNLDLFLMTGLSMNYGLYQGQRLELRMDLPYETIGELELLSLHRVKNRINSMGVHPQVRKRLIYEFVRENQDYRTKTGKKWSCITPDSLDGAVDKVNDYLIKQVKTGIATIEDTRIRELMDRKMSEQVDVQMGIIKQWFVDNYEDILYNMERKIPYIIVKRMRETLSMWALDNINPFGQSIEKLIEDTAESIGMNIKGYGSYENIWNDLKKY